MDGEFFVHPTAVVDEGCTIGEGTKIWHFSHIMTSCTIGKNCNIGQNVVISPSVVLGNGCKVQNNVSVYTGVECEDVINPRSAVVRKDEYRKTHIGKGASIGANATIVCGHDIGEYALVGAGSVVTKNVLPYALVVGNPARQIGWVSEYGHRLSFNQEGKALCPQTNQEYQLEDGKVKRIK